MGAGAGRAATVAMVTTVLLGTTAFGYGVVRLTGHERLPDSRLSTGPAESVATRADSDVDSAAGPSGAPSTSGVSPAAATTGTRSRVHVTVPLPAARPRVTPPPGPRLLGPGDSSDEVRDLQARLRQVAWYSGDVTDDYGPSTTAAVKGFQAKREIAVTGYVDQRTLRRLDEMTRAPTADELANRLPGSTTTDAALDPRCTTGRALCVDKSSSTIRWVVDGSVRRTMAVRFGSSYTPTREGLFHVGVKSRDHVSSIYDTPMPFAMFFSGGQAVHYSADFAANGYSGASHGCVNVRDRAGIEWLFDQVSAGDKVVIYWS